MEQFKKLFSLFFKLDFRDKDKSGMKKVFGILLAYLLTNFFISFNNYNGFDELSFAVLSFSVNIFFIAFVVLNDFDNLFLSKKNYDTLVILPVKQNNFFTAKFASASLMIFAFFTASSVSQLVFFYLITGSAAKAALFYFTALLFNFTFMGLLLLLYMFILSKFSAKSNLFVYALQIFFFFFIMYSSTASAKAYKLGKMNLLEVEFVRFMPQVLFAKAMYELSLLPVCILITVSVYFLLYKFMSAKFYELHEKISKVERKKNRKFKFTFWGDFIHRHILRNNLQRASYSLMANQLKNSRFLRIKYIPMLLFPLIFCLLGIFFSKEFLVINSEQRIGSIIPSALLVFSPSITFMIIISFRMLFSNTRISDENSGSSEAIFSMLPIKDNAQLNLGISKFIYANFYLPVAAVMIVLLLIKLDISTILLNLLYISSALYLMNTIFMHTDKRLPFSLDSAKFNSASKFGEVMFNMLIGLIIFIIQIFIFQNVIFVVGASLLFLGIAFLVNRN